jgi:hypothetical protein
MNNFNKHTYIASAQITTEQHKSDTKSLLAVGVFWCMTIALVVFEGNLFNLIAQHKSDTWALVVCSGLLAVLYKPYMKASKFLCNYAETPAK